MTITITGMAYKGSTLLIRFKTEKDQSYVVKMPKRNKEIEPHDIQNAIMDFFQDHPTEEDQGVFSLVGHSFEL